ncbi:hypothetical protein X742_29485 [Mesorhizobium sp. LNHC232B00]|nr:hypothetical protein X742_29485 [Mesorhizobium sp. LNHC232B00]
MPQHGLHFRPLGMLRLKGLELDNFTDQRGLLGLGVH